IVCDIPGSGVQTITLLTAPPALDVSSGGITVDATTQPGYAGSPLVAIDCGGADLIVFEFSGSGGGIKGLAVGNCGVVVDSGASTSITVQACHIGVDAAGTTATPNHQGISIDETDFLIGGPAAADRNIISGNGEWGVFIGSLGTGTIQNNYIGTDVT